MGCGTSTEASSAPPKSAAERYALRQQWRERRRQERAAIGLPADAEDTDGKNVASEAQTISQAAAARRKYTEQCDQADAAALARISSVRPQPTRSIPTGLAARAPGRWFEPVHTDGIELLPACALPGQVPVAGAHGADPMTAPDELPALESPDSRAATGSGAFSMSGTTRSSSHTFGSPAGALSRVISVFELLESDDDEDGDDDDDAQDVEDARLACTAPRALDLSSIDGGKTDQQPRRDCPPTQPFPAAFDTGDEDDVVLTEYILSREALSKFSSYQQAHCHGSTHGRKSSAVSGDFDSKSATSRATSAARATPLDSLRSKIETPVDAPGRIQRRKNTNPPTVSPSRTAVVPGRIPRRKRSAERNAQM